MSLLAGLNDAQAKAVEHLDGPLLILAGAGSGKTKTLTHRVAHMIASAKATPHNILAVTFTNKAAREMRERLWQLSHGQAVEQVPRNFMPWMGTFHGICVRLLRREGAAIGIDTRFVIYDEDDRRGLVKQAIKQLGVADKSIKPAAVSGVISKAKSELQTPDDIRASASYPMQRTMADIYAKYETLRKQAGALDFDDLLHEAVRLLREAPEVRKKYQQQFRYICIDEYQDTNAAQYTLVKSLVNSENNICVVGDDWQSIYSWRGADFTNILNFERDFPGAEVVKLEQNYRSTGAILEAAQNVITKNTQRSDKKLWTDTGPGAPVELIANHDEAEEAGQVANRIGTQTMIKARRYSDYAVLYRTNAQSYTIERALLQQRIPYQIVGGVRFYDRKEIKDVIAYLRLIYQPRDVVSFERIVNVPKRGVGQASVDKLNAWRNETGNDVLTMLQHIGEIDGLPGKARNALARLGGVLTDLREKALSGTAPSELIEQLIEKTSYRDSLRDGTPQAEDREENLGSLVSDAQHFADIDSFLEEVALMSSADTSTSGDAVTLMTIHAAKGLEFPAVFVVGMEEAILPHARVFDGPPSELEEERRLCYVAMTRAREELILSYASRRLQFGQANYNAPSRFLSDAGLEVLPAAAGYGMQANWYGVNNQPDMPARAPQADSGYDMQPDFDIGDRVRSAQFGSGEVVDIDGLAVGVRFDNGTTKKLNIEFARLEKQ